MQGESSIWLRQMTDTYYYICPIYTSGEGLMIVWVARGPPLMGGTMTYSAHGGLTIPYI